MESIKEPRAIVIQYNGTEAPLSVLQTINDVLNSTCSYAEVDIQQFSSEDISKLLLKNSKTNATKPIIDENPIISALGTIVTKYQLDLSKMKTSEITAKLIKKLIGTNGDEDNDLVHAVYIIGMNNEDINSDILKAFEINKEKILAIRQAFKLSSYL